MQLKSSQPRDSLYHTWWNMLQRCNNPKATTYRFYGAKGVTVDPRWSDQTLIPATGYRGNACMRKRGYQNFLDDMGSRPENYTLDRIDPNKGYGPNNCRWASKAVQSQNRVSVKNRYSVPVTYLGMTKTLGEWSEYLDIAKHKLCHRYKKGYPLEIVFSNGDIHGQVSKHELTPRSLSLGEKRLLTHKGRTQALAAWARELGLSPQTLRQRLDCQGMSVEEALETPRFGSQVYKTPPVVRASHITFKGVTRTKQEWADHLKIGFHALTWRLIKWSLEDALTTPANQRPKKSK